MFCFDKSIAIVTKLYNRNLSISNFQGNLTLKSFVIKDNDIYSMIILWLNLFVYNLKLDIIFPSSSCNFHDNFVEQRLRTVVIIPIKIGKSVFIPEILVLAKTLIIKMIHSHSCFLSDTYKNAECYHWINTFATSIFY